MPTSQPLVDVLSRRVLPTVLDGSGKLPLWMQNRDLESRRLSWRVPWGSPPDSRRHQGFEVCFVLAGEAAALIGDECYQLRTGDALIVPTRTEHDFSNTSSDYDALWIEVKRTETLVHLQQFRSRSFEPDRPGATLRCAFECHATALAIERELETGWLMHEQLVADGVKRLAILVLRNLQALASSGKKAQGDHNHTGAVAAAIELINCDFGKHLSVPALSQQLFVSQSQLNRLFRQETGMSVWQYVREVRLTQALRLLTATDQPIQEIAHEVGFQSIHHFCRAYKKFHGCTPTHSRQGEG